MQTSPQQRWGIWDKAGLSTPLHLAPTHFNPLHLTFLHDSSSNLILLLGFSSCSLLGPQDVGMVIATSRDLEIRITADLFRYFAGCVREPQSI